MTGQTADEIRTIVHWHEALNDGDPDLLVALSQQDVEMGGPRGVVSGAEVLRDWVARANIRLYPQRFFYNRETVVVEEAAEWRSPETGEVIGDSTVGSVFVVRDGRVASVERHENLASALDAAGFDGSYEVELA